MQLKMPSIYDSLCCILLVSSVIFPRCSVCQEGGLFMIMLVFTIANFVMQL